MAWVAISSYLLHRNFLQFSLCFESNDRFLFFLFFSGSTLPVFSPFTGFPVVILLMTAVDDDEDLWNDAHDRMEDDRSGHPAGIEVMAAFGDRDSEDRADGTDKITADGDQSSPLDLNEDDTLSTHAERASSDIASIHSLPAVHVSHSQAILPSRPSTARALGSPTTAYRENPRSSREPLSPSESSLAPYDRRNRHRSAIEVCTV